MIGTKVYHFAELQSTNEYASHLLSKKAPIDGTVVTTDHQSHGKGQYGRTWQAEKGQNITLSVILYPNISAEDQFGLNMMASNAVAALVEELTSRKAKVKWPNDVYVAGGKVSGILIQNYISGMNISGTVMGIGININQTEWPSMDKKATSLALITGQQLNIEEFRLKLYDQLNRLYPSLKSQDPRLKRDYTARLYGHQETHLFEINQEIVSGVIQGIDAIGRLVVHMGGENRAFSRGEIRIIMQDKTI